jgi:hypothetical protein
MPRSTKTTITRRNNAAAARAARQPSLEDVPDADDLTPLLPGLAPMNVDEDDAPRSEWDLDLGSELPHEDVWLSTEADPDGDLDISSDADLVVFSQWLSDAQRSANRATRFISAYAGGLTGAHLGYLKDKYRGHRVLPQGSLREIKEALGIN